MIKKYNRKQIALIPFHLFLCVLGVLFGWFFFAYGAARVFPNADFLFLCTIAGIGLVCTFISGIRFWRSGHTQPPELLDALPRHDAEEASDTLLLRILSNLLLLGPLQLMHAIQRIRNLIPDTAQQEQTLAAWKSFATSQNGWHSTDHYANDYKTMFTLIRMQHLDYSPTKRRVCAALL